jgi:hypothetical protein
LQRLNKEVLPIRVEILEPSSQRTVFALDVNTTVQETIGSTAEQLDNAAIPTTNQLSPFVKVVRDVSRDTAPTTLTEMAIADGRSPVSGSQPNDATHTSQLPKLTTSQLLMLQEHSTEKSLEPRARRI